jgi:hypothetical protein
MEQNRVLKRDIANSADAGRRASTMQEKMGQIRRQLRGNQDELKALRDQHEKVIEEKALLAQALEHAEADGRGGRGGDGDFDLDGRGFGGGGRVHMSKKGSKAPDGGKAQEQVEQQQVLIRSLRQQLHEANETQGRRNGVGDTSRSQVMVLRKENERLQEQVCACL